MMATFVFAVDRTNIAPLEMPARFRHDVTYFASPAGVGTAPEKLPPGEYWVAEDDARRIADDGVICIVSPLDSSSRTELEITEDQERWLEWLLKNGVQHVRLETR